MIRSTTPSWPASSASCSRPPDTSETAPSGNSGATIEASTAFEWAAEEDPRSTIALPDFRHSAAASTVTFGRAS